MELVIELNKKNRKAFKTFFTDNFPSLVLFAGKYVENVDLATDIAQECFIRLWCSDISFVSLEKIKGFLYTTARNMALNQLKHKGVENFYIQYSKKESEAFFRDQIIEEETYQLLYQAIRQLSSQTQKIILLSLQGLSNAEIADKLHISVNSVRKLKYNAYRKLRILLRDHFYLMILLLKLKIFE